MTDQRITDAQDKLIKTVKAFMTVLDKFSKVLKSTAFGIATEIENISADLSEMLNDLEKNQTH